MKVVIIGSGAAGISAIQSIRQHDPDKNISITLISAEREQVYSPCALPYLISDSIPSRRLCRLEPSFYRKNKINTSWGSPVCKINPEEKSLALKNGKTFFYDKLLIATGSVPIKPDILGIDKKGVFFVDTLKNTRRIKAYLRKEKIIKRQGKVAIVGAGFTGIETAIALRKQGIQVIVIEMLDKILAKVLDNEFAGIALNQINSMPALNSEKNIDFKLSSAVTEIKGKTKVKSVVLHNGKNLHVDMAIISIGVKPNIDFIKNIGIKINKGIVVDEQMQTSLPEIYAAGDIAETKDHITGQPAVSAIWLNAIEQGKIAGLNIAGQKAHYPGAASINVLNLEGVPVISMGQISTAPNKKTSPYLVGSYTYQNENSIRRLFFQHLAAENTPHPDKNKQQAKEFVITGFEAIGEFRDAGYIWSLIQKRLPLSEISQSMLADNAASRSYITLNRNSAASDTAINT